MPARHSREAVRDYAARARGGGARILGVVTGVLIVAAIALAVSVWPVTAALGTLVAGVLVLAWRAPEWAVAAGILLVGLEGSVKLLLGLEPTPLPSGGRAVGAATIDLALFAGIAGVLVADRLRTPRMLWQAASRVERAAMLALCGWLGLSVLQIAQGGDPSRGVHGFRLFHAYVLVAVAAGVAVARRRPGPVVGVALAIGAIVSSYAALRVAIGPAETELQFATSIDSTVVYGHAVRAVGSFSSAVGLGSFLTPVAIFGIVAGLLLPRLRVAAWAVAGLAVVAILGSYGRGPLIAIAAGLVFAVFVVSAVPDVPRRRKLAVAGLVVCTLGATYGGVLAAGQASPELSERAKGLRNPFADASVQMRLVTWGGALDDVRSHPLGLGIGAVGSASAPERGGFRTTDNSFLKVLLEQGIPGAAAFMLWLLGAVLLLARRLVRATGEGRAVGLSALAAFVGFLVLSMTGEYVEQPGKAVAWALLGVAAAFAFRHEQPEAT